jgi:nicotinate-nucleotide pyrophosphorylase (carboxylating)
METNRIQQVRRCFDSKPLNLENPEYRDFAVAFFNYLLSQDLGVGDISLFPRSLYQQSATAQILAKEKAVIAGLDETRFFLQNQELATESAFQNGDTIQSGETLLQISGAAGEILSFERTILNILQRLSGIATRTARYTEILSDAECFVAGTRKTIWGLLDKSAIQHGGGLTHRLGLYDAAMLKENHLRILQQIDGYQTVAAALEEIPVNNPTMNFIEVEVTNANEFRQIAELLIQSKNTTAKVIMFDHFPAEQIRRLIGETRKQGHYDQLLFEASGNITLNNLAEYGDSGVDVISVGALTHSIKSIDFSLLFY